MSSGLQRGFSMGSTSGPGVMLIMMHGLPPSVFGGVGASG